MMNRRVIPSKALCGSFELPSVFLRFNVIRKAHVVTHRLYAKLKLAMKRAFLRYRPSRQKISTDGDVRPELKS